MKLLVKILAGFALLCVAALAFVALHAMEKERSTKNANQTAAAREAAERNRKEREQQQRPEPEPVKPEAQPVINADETA